MDKFIKYLYNERMKVIAFNGSPHKSGTVNAGLEILCGELKKSGIEAEILHAGGEDIHGCKGCGSCRKTGLCVIKDDITNEYIEKARAADGIVLASPVYYGGIAGGFKCLLDRMFYAGINLKYKAGAAVASLRRSGGTTTFQQLCNYLNLGGAVITPTVYWNVIHGNSAEELKEDGEGQYIMKVTGRNMTWLMKRLAGAELPEQETPVRTNFVRS
jgi:multimeric flavodoxin WrbA